MTKCNAPGPEAWRQKYFQLFPSAWGIPAWFVTAPYDAKRRFLRTLAPTALMSHLKNSGFMVPAVRTAWRKMHSKWLAFWISAKLHIVGGARTAPGREMLKRPKQ